MEKTGIKTLKIRKDESKMLKVYCGRCNDITSHTITFKSLDERVEQVHYESLCNYCVMRAKIKYDTVPTATAETLNLKEFSVLWQTQLYDD